MASRSFRTPSRKYRGNFKSPFQTTKPQSPSPLSVAAEPAADDEVLKQEISSLKIERKRVDQEIQQLQLEGYRGEELKIHIDKLHEYNDIKDAGQLILGRLASIEGVTTRAMYTKYGLEEED